MEYVFFCSYSHMNNRDGTLRKFITSLQEEVLQRCPPRFGHSGPETIGFFDSDGIKTGEEWGPKLSHAVRHARVPKFLEGRLERWAAPEWCAKQACHLCVRLTQRSGRLGNYWLDSGYCTGPPCRLNLCFGAANPTIGRANERLVRIVTTMGWVK